MRTVDDLLEAASRVNVPQLAVDSLLAAAHEYLRLQKNQLSQGLRSDGKPIFRLSTGSTQYSPAYAKKKGRTSPIDLHDTGAFYGELFLVENGNSTDTVVADSADSKSGMLQENYGSEIIGLNDGSREELVPTTSATFHTELTNQLNRST